MEDSDDYGDDFDDTAFLEAATQAEKENTPPFLASPRPTKRRKLSGPNERSAPSIPPSKQRFDRRRQPFLSSEDEDDSEPDVCATSRGNKSAATELDDGEQPTAAKPVCSAARKKKARIKRQEESDEEPENGSPRKETVAAKRKNRIHVPTANLDLTDLFFTQPSREPSPPWKPRGAIWQKPRTNIGVHRPSGLDAMKTTALPGRQSIASRPVSRGHKSPGESDTPMGIDTSPELPATSKTGTAYDLTQELADLPSDAFASSSSSPQKQDDVVLLSERRTRVVAPQSGLRQTTLFGRQGVNSQVPPSQVNKRYNFIVDQKEEPPTHHKLDTEATKTWIYPTNLGTIRDYQFNIVARGLFHNLLVALPTGLGKTFIAATIMLNWFRWTTEAQIVFMAPTKPLVAQQVDACFHIVGIPRSSTVMLTGGVPPAVRAEEWASKRVFFMTPQTLLNDLKSGYADPKKMVLLVVDEAHRATGGYAYVEVVSFLRRFNSSFRVLALTATPGADVEAVQKVIDGLDISRIEIRTENSLDIQHHIHHRKVEKHVFSNSEEMEMCMDLYTQALQPCVSKLAGLNAFWTTNPLELTPYGCLQARKRWFQEAGHRAPQAQKAMVNGIFQVLNSISQGMDLLKYHGIGPFYVKIKEFKDEQQRSKSKYRDEICNSDAFKKLMVRLHTWVSNENFVGHPKLEFLQQVILDHFVNAVDGLNSDGGTAAQTRIMVFAHFRDSAEEIVRVLRKHQPMIRPRVFVGQSTGKNSDGMDQKEQLGVIEKFKEGTFNTLVATSIGEEGLDIGEVDLIICYDSKASPIRMLQRMGRTGRKREGKIIMLQMEGKEERDAAKAKDNYEQMQKLIAEGSRFAFHDEISRRILPRDVQPVVERRVVEIPIENSQSDWLPEPKKTRGRAAKKPSKKFHMPDGVIAGFVTAGRMDEEIAPKARGKKVTPVYPSEEVVMLLPLESVLLDERAAHDLERRYQTVFDEDDAPIVGALDLGRHQAEQRVLSRTHHFRGHGRAAQYFVHTMQRMHEMDHNCEERYRKNLHHSDCEPEPEQNLVVSDTESKPVVQEDMWADDDPPSQPLPKLKAKPGPKPKAKTTPKQAAPRGRPRKNPSATTTPARQPKANSKASRTETPNWRMSGFAQEGASSSPPPTDPRMRVASQAETIGSDDTVGGDEPQDTQAFRMDSDLVSFIADDDEEIEVPISSLPSLDLAGLGKGTQAVVKASKPKRLRKAEKIFTSDPTDDDALVTSDSDDDVPIGRQRSKGARKAMTFVVDSGSEDDVDDEPIIPRRRARRVVDDDDDE
ncbi:P-loop containing nucleoside triphosphate hydrolase protein [Trematosphaeria pertusa]|uniref:ATP-dependent DNA helicase n=1 Tax=Trematosphaeria pertusa TaxID=390896 RepID=A0A6A6IRK7_9PLEO|nr:P-loop containing nucleoside triphosphate hydrolase protein [Trematosphaeria pertusa]KAF2253195.1 P-loop containing nucleoside triphosphate hydrolase protein [Trematosphaeria pertusa]